MTDDKSFQERVRDERREIEVRIEKLELFRASEPYRRLDRAERDRMTFQLLSMRAYSFALLARIDAFTT